MVGEVGLKKVVLGEAVAIARQSRQFRQGVA